jgi:hypothetical protein
MRPKVPTWQAEPVGNKYYALLTAFWWPADSYLSRVAVAPPVPVRESREPRGVLFAAPSVPSAGAKNLGGLRAKACDFAVGRRDVTGAAWLAVAIVHLMRLANCARVRALDYPTIYDNQ